MGIKNFLTAVVSFFDRASDRIEAAFFRLVGKSTGRETLRMIGLGALALLAFIPMWSASQVVLYGIGILSAILLAAHWARKILFPYVDLSAVYFKAIQTPQGAASVWCSIIVFFLSVGLAVLWIAK